MVLILQTYIGSESLVAHTHLADLYEDSPILSKLMLRRASANTNTLPFAAQTMILGMPVTLMEGNACDHLRVGSCPALNGHDFTFSVVFDVPVILPPLNVVVTTLLWNDYGDVGVCVSVDVILT
ncbi:uncharacterized protein LOC119074902 [Bradysia coprophila]|uniref:uncharacterized protein LOC119074902 n=1 Tax=Bradysia coprophila TaxID=38358 RepID=UPI00187DD28C|nr:uncharacterized protein LOC119074902 [Bradysia coprophila]